MTKPTTEGWVSAFENCGCSHSNQEAKESKIKAVSFWENKMSVAVKNPTQKLLRRGTIYLFDENTGFLYSGR